MVDGNGFIRKGNMNTTILVIYASKYGSTQEVAETIAARLREKGFSVELAAMSGVRSLDPYGAVVLGSPLYIGNLLKDAQQFLGRLQAGLVQRPTAFFVLGPTESKEEDWKDVRQQLDLLLAKMDWFKPTAVELFGGRLDPARLRFPDNLLAILPASPLHDKPASDVRDWGAIQAWADGLPARLGIEK